MDELEFPTLDLDAVDETPAEGTEEVLETPADDAEVVTPPTEGEETPAEGEEEPVDGRKVPDEVRKALKAFRDASPENAKAASALRDSYGRELAYKAVFPTVKDAQSAQTTLQTVESYGGVEGIQATIAEIEEVDQLLQAGDARAIDKIAEVAGEGFAKIAPAMLDRLQASNPEAYATAIRPHLVAAIGSSGLTDAFAAVLQAQQFAATPGASPEFKAKWEKDANEGLQKIHQYLQGLGKKPEGAPTTPAGAPDKLSERETALAAREAQAFNTEVGTLANTKMNSSLAKAVAPYVKGMSQEARADYVQGVYDEVAKLAKADKNYQRNKDAAFKSPKKEAGKIAQLMSAKFEEVVGTAAKTVASRRYGKVAPAAAGASEAKGRPAVEAGTAQKPVLVKELPARNLIDFDKTSDDMMMRGIRVLKNGKVIKLDR